MVFIILIKMYLTIGDYADCWLYRKIGIVAINLYQGSLRKLHSRECQFKVSCSQFLKKHLSENVSFEDLSLNMNRRIIDCSEPLDMSYSSASGVVAIGPSGHRYRQEELSDALIERIENRVSQLR